MRLAVFYFAQAEAGWHSHRAGGAPEGTFASHALSTLSARLKTLGHEPYLVDGRSFNCPEHFEDVARGLHFDVALAWVMPRDRDVAAHAVSVLRKVGHVEPIIAAGPAVSATGERLSDETCDLLGEPDEVLPQLLDRLMAGEPKIPGVIRDGLDSPVADLETLPEIDRGHFNVEIEKASSPYPLLPTPVYSLTCARGCPACHDAILLGRGWRCRECWPGPGRPSRMIVRLRDPNRFVDDVCRLSGSHGTGGLGAVLIHDSYLASLDWVRRVAREWQDTVPRTRLGMPLDPRVVRADPSVVRELTQCGLTWVPVDVGHGKRELRELLGVPWSSDDVLAAAEVLHRNRVNLAIHVTVGLPGETDADTDETERLLGHVGAARVHVHVWNPVPGMHAWDEATRKALLTNDPVALDDAPKPRVKMIDYERLLRRVANWRPAYEAKLIDLPPGTMPERPITRLAADATPAMSRANTFASTPSTAGTASATIAQPTINPSLPPPEDWASDVARQTDAHRIAWAGATRPKATAVIVVHDPYALYLREAFRSVEEQTLRTRQGQIVEVVIVDNGTRQPSVREFLDYKKSAKIDDLRVKVVRFPENVNNVAIAWNAALDVADGEYVCFLDADNRKCPEFMERLVARLDADPRMSVAHCRSWVINARGERTGTRGRVGEFALEQQVQGNYVDSGEMLVRRSTFDSAGRLDERMRACEDWDLVTRLKALGHHFSFVDETLTEYRSHSENRLHTSVTLGAEDCAQLLRSKVVRRAAWDVRVVTPALAGLTASQRQVIAGVVESVRAVEWVRVVDDDGGPSFACDLALVLAPFRLGENDVEALFRRVENHGGPNRPQVVAVHMEDPQAVVANSRLVGRADWIVANDVSAWRHYRARLREAGQEERAKRVICWNALGASPTFLASLPDVPRDVDLLVLGYGYPSRRAIFEGFLKDAPTTWRMAVIGDGWADTLARFRGRFQHAPTQGEVETARWLARARLCLVTHRGQGDIGGFPLFPPESVHRGFLESAAGCAVLSDDARKFGCGGVEFVRFADGRDAARKAFDLLKDHERREQLVARNSALCRGPLSMASRVRAILNAVRDERWEFVVS